MSNISIQNLFIAKDMINQRIRALKIENCKAVVDVELTSNIVIEEVAKYKISRNEIEIDSLNAVLNCINNAISNTYIK